MSISLNTLCLPCVVYLLRPLYPAEQIKRLIIFVSTSHSEVEVSWTYVGISRIFRH